MLQASSVGGNQWGRHCDTHAAEGVTDRAGAATLTHLGVANPDDEPGIHHTVPCALIVPQQAVDFEQVRVHGCSLQRQGSRHSARAQKLHRYSQPHMEAVHASCMAQRPPPAGPQL